SFSRGVDLKIAREARLLPGGQSSRGISTMMPWAIASLSVSRIFSEGILRERAMDRTGIPSSARRTAMAVASGFGAGSIAAAVSMDWSLLDVEVPGCSRLHLVVAVMQPVLTGCQEHFTV